MTIIFDNMTTQPFNIIIANDMKSLQQISLSFEAFFIFRMEILCLHTMNIGSPPIVPKG